jgi:hypothetical protein
MALFIRQDEEQTELQKRIASDLYEKSKQKTELAKSPDLVDDSQYIQGTKETTSLAWAWIVIVVIAVGIAIWLMITGLAR